MTKNHITGAPYSNIIIVSNDGKLLATISQRKAKWYVRKNLAKAIPPPEGYTGAIQLYFEANVSRSPKVYEIKVTENKCVICGKEDTLTRHHVIPWVIRRYFPLRSKQYSRQWCVLLCVDCHQNVEALTQPLYKVDFPKGGQVSKNSNITLQMIKHEGNIDKIDPKKLQLLLSRSTYTCVKDIPRFRNKNKSERREEMRNNHQMEIKRWALNFIRENGGVSGVKDYFRKIFLRLNPKYLPEGYLT